MIRFEDSAGRALYIRPDTVTAVGPSLTGEAFSFVMAVEGRGYTVRGNPDEVMAQLQGRPVNLRTVLQSAWDETHQLPDQSTGSVAHTERVLLLVLAEKLGVSINRDTPTSAS